MKKRKLKRVRSFRHFVIAWNTPLDVFAESVGFLCENAWATRLSPEMRARFSTGVNNTGLVVLNAAGKLLFASHRAETLLTFYFPSCTGNEPWPKRLTLWVAQSMPRLHRMKELIRAPLRSEREGRRLLIRVVETRLERILLLDEERIWTDGPNRHATVLTKLGLTTREAEVLFWIAEGKSNAEIGVILLIALRTVKKHIEHIFPKLGVENRTCAAARASEVLHRGISSHSTASSIS